MDESNVAVSMRVSRRRVRTVATVLVLAVVGILASCFPVPIGDASRSKVDPRLTGAWRRTDDPTQYCLVAACDDHVYTVIIYEKKTENNVTSLVRGPTLRGWLTEIKGTQFLTLEGIEPIPDPNSPDYIICTVSVVKDQVVVRGLRNTYAAFEKAKTRQELEAAIAEHLADPEIYAGEQQTYERVERDAFNTLLPAEKAQ